MRRIITIAVALALWVSAAGAQEPITGEFVYYRHAKVLHLKAVTDGDDLLLLPSPSYPEIPVDGEYRIDPVTGSLSLADYAVIAVCEWPGWAAAHAHPKLSRILGSVGRVGGFVEAITGAVSRVIGVCRAAMKQ